MKYKTETDCYLAWYDRMVKFIADHYDCKITYPRNVSDINNMVDGLKLEFNYINWGCYLTNFCMYQIFTSDKGVRHTSSFKVVCDFIESSLLSKIKK